MHRSFLRRSVTLGEVLLSLRQKVGGNSFWEAVQEAIPIAQGLKEVDSLLSIVHCHLAQKSSGDRLPSDASVKLLMGATAFADIEANAVLSFGAQTMLSDTPDEVTSSGATKSEIAEALEISGGTMPLSFRHRCCDGAATVALLRALRSYSSLAAALESAVTVFTENAATVSPCSFSLLLQLVGGLSAPHEWDTKMVDIATAAVREKNCGADSFLCSLLKHLDRTDASDIALSEALAQVARFHVILDSGSSQARIVPSSLPLRALTYKLASRAKPQNDDAAQKVLLAKLATTYCEAPSEFSSEFDVAVKDSPSGCSLAMDFLQLSHLIAHSKEIDVAVEHIRVVVEGVHPANLADEAKQWLAAAHKLVISALLSRGRKEDVDLAYQLVIIHKYHGLSVDVQLVNMLGEKLCETGDSRMFNLVDACALFSGNKLDLKTIELMFRACVVAGDHHRARTLYGILRDSIPGVSSKLSAASVVALTSLKVLPRREHLFTSLSAEVPCIPKQPPSQ